MTLKEAKKLKLGDRVLVEAIISGTLADDNEVLINVERASEFAPNYALVHCEMIREKIAPDRRKFRKGDIVSVPSGCFLEVAENEDIETPLVTVKNKEKDHEFFLFSDLTLICAAEDRSDKVEKPAAAPAELQRGNLTSKIGGEA